MDLNWIQHKTLLLAECWHILTLAFGTLRAELDVLETHLLNIFVETDGAWQAELVTECRHQRLHKFLRFRRLPCIRNCWDAHQTQYELVLIKGKPNCKQIAPYTVKCLI